MNLQDLYAEFPRDDVIWRPQGSVSKNGTILALAYIDARDVMDRLDKVCGPENWRDAYHETPKGRVICTLSIRIGDEWVGKSDGAGETQVEGEKGAISDALKRAAVKWGIGRYLYDLESPWVPCETYQGNDGKPRFRKFSVDPWTKVRRAPRVFVVDLPGDEAEPPAEPQKLSQRAAAKGPAAPSRLELFIGHMDTAATLDELAEVWSAHRDMQANRGAAEAKDRNKARLSQPIVLGDQPVPMDTPF